MAELFSFHPERAEAVLKRALSRGADFAELFLEDGTARNLTLNEKIIDAATTHRRCGAGVRVFSQTASAYAYCSGWDQEDLLDIAQQAAEALAAQVSLKAQIQLRPWIKVCEMKAPIRPYEAVTVSEREQYLLRAVHAAHAYSPEIHRVTASLADEDRRVIIFNSEGVWAEDRRIHGRLFIQTIAQGEGRLETGSVAPGAGQDFSFFEALDLEAQAREAARIATTVLHAPECPSGQLPVVIENGFGGVIFHEACGHSLEATSVALNNSEFSGKLGQQIAATCVSAVDDGTLLGAWGSAQVDDEGQPTQRNLLIDHGICTGYLIDRLGSRRMGMEPTGSARRQDYSYPATSRMTNTFILAGQDDADEMIKELPQGLYAKTLGGGSVNPLTGEFNFAVQEGYWIENGELKHPVRGATLIGKGADVLMKIDRVAANLKRAQGMCGSASGMVRADVGQPRLRVQQLTVGGRGEALS